MPIRVLRWVCSEDTCVPQGAVGAAVPVLVGVSLASFLCSRCFGHVMRASQCSQEQRHSVGHCSRAEMLIHVELGMWWLQTVLLWVWTVHSLALCPPVGLNGTQSSTLWLRIQTLWGPARSYTMPCALCRGTSCCQSLPVCDGQRLSLGL